jgi:hypothetical protein
MLFGSIFQHVRELSIINVTLRDHFGAGNDCAVQEGLAHVVKRETGWTWGEKRVQFCVADVVKREAGWTWGEKRVKRVQF